MRLIKFWEYPEPRPVVVNHFGSLCRPKADLSKLARFRGFSEDIRHDSGRRLRGGPTDRSTLIPN